MARLTDLEQKITSDKARCEKMEKDVAMWKVRGHRFIFYFFFFFFFFLYLSACFTSYRYFVFSIAVLPHSPGVVNCHLLLRRESWILPLLFTIRAWGSFVH